MSEFEVVHVEMLDLAPPEVREQALHLAAGDWTRGYPVSTRTERYQVSVCGAFVVWQDLRETP